MRQVLMMALASMAMLTHAEARWRTPDVQTEQIDGREVLIQAPSGAPKGLLVALHGGGGNARFLMRHLDLGEAAGERGLLVAYVNGSSASARLPDRMAAWNAGQGCCGQPAEQKVPDVAVLQSIIKQLAQRYQIPAGQVFGVGHSNGAMMMQTLMCQTDVMRRGVSLAGALMAEGDACPGARGKAILAIHGKQDANVPPEGGPGTKGYTKVPFVSEAQSQARFQRSGGQYAIEWLESDHNLEDIAKAVQQADGLDLPHAVVRFVTN